ncbi:MAG: DoxX family protein [Acidobacteria bacterium]|nr:DoxX family protein [Acidobacteriota bacterium]
MHKYLGRWEGGIYSLLRFVAGFLFALHGAQKLFGALGGIDGKGGTVEIASLLGLAGIIELVGGTLIAVGLFASWAAFLASGEMAVAYFRAHAPQDFWPLLNSGEVVVLYCFLFLYIAARGDGPLSLGGAMRKR